MNSSDYPDQAFLKCKMFFSNGNIVKFYSFLLQQDHKSSLPSTSKEKVILFHIVQTRMY